jgi:hypothetical protein
MASKHPPYTTNLCACCKERNSTDEPPPKKQKTSEQNYWSLRSHHGFAGGLSPIPDGNIYKPLADNELRCVALKPGMGTQPIIIEFVVLELTMSMDYEALSYVWGEPVRDQSIFVRVHNKSVGLQVTRNLESALKQLRHSTEDRLLWIDALSINQMDNTERSRQVAKMHQIFQGARNVCIWLGPRADESDIAMDYISEVLDFSAHSLRKVKKQTLALSRLLARPWFSRRWVVQEMALARTATVHCGKKHILWTDFADAIALFGSIRDEVVKIMSPEEVYELGEIHSVGAANLVDISGNIHRKDLVDGRILQRLLDLEGLLARLAMFEATQAHDAIYAIIALGKDTFDRGKIPVDYTMPAAKLFAIVTRYIITESKSLDIICRPWVPRYDDLKLPSWIPTVATHPYVRRHDGKYDRHNADILVGPPEHKLKPYNAAGDIGVNTTKLRIKIEDSEETATLTTDGIQVDTIAEAGGRCINGNIPDGWTKMAGWADRNGPVPPEFWRTLVADRGPDGDNPPHWYGRACQYVFRRSATADLDTTKMITISQSADKDFLRRVQSVTWGRKLFLDGSGRPGIGPEKCEVGDHICILWGCSVPVVLRPCGLKYSLVGECYIQGMMGGEAMIVLRESGSLKGKTFKII